MQNPKLYDEEGNEIIPPEGAKELVVGMEAMAWTFDNPGTKSTFIYKPDHYDGPMAEDYEVEFKFAPIPRITNDTWYVIPSVPYPVHTPRINGKLFFKYRQRYRNRTKFYSK